MADLGISDSCSHGVQQRGSVSVTFERRYGLPGVEARTIELQTGAQASGFCSYSSDFEFLVPVTFEGELWHRRRWLTAHPGRLMAARPGDIFRARRVRTPGYCKSLMLETTVLSRYLAEHETCLEELRLPLCVTMSMGLHGRFMAALDALTSRACLMGIQAKITEFVAALLKDLHGLRIPESQRSADAAVHVRQRLQKDTTGEVDLETLARETGLSRFQLLRAFKQRFGIPPQAYRMQMRIAMARKLLRSGMAPAGVAAELGFVDQSHMTRHFKRALGVTPARYAKSMTLL